MANVQRTVSTLLKIDGEQQYKAAIANINREQATLKSSIALVDAQFRGQANSMAALTAKSQIYAQQQTLITRSLTATKAMYAAAQQAVTKYGDEVAKLRVKIASEGDAEGKLGKQLTEAQERLQGARNATESYRKKVVDAEVRLFKINDTIKTNSRYMDEAKKSTDGTASSIDKFGKEVKTATSESEKFGEKGSAAFQQLASALIAAGLIRGMQELIDLFKQALDASIEFETAFTGVLKTVEGSPEQLAAINSQIKEMATNIPLTTTELLKIAEVAGQLGIATNDVGKFTEVMAALGVSTNLSSTDAATTLARFAKVTGLDSSQYENLGSAIVALGNNSATTEAEIVDMGMGIAAAGTQVGMTQAEILAYAAAISSAGMESQAGGSAISKTLIEMSLAAQTGSKDLDNFAKIAGMTSQEFANLFDKSASDALTAFISGLASGSQDAIAALDNMGITEIRQRDAMLRLANSIGTVTTSLDISSSAFTANTALAEESAKFYATTESKTVLLKNAVNALGVTIGDQFNPALRKALDTGTDVVQAIDEFLQKNPGMTAAMTGFATALGVVALAIAGVNIVVSILIPAITAFGTAMTGASGPVGIIIVALAALIAGLNAASAAFDTNTEKYEDQIEKSKQLLEELEASKEAYKDRVESIESESLAVDGLVKRLDDLLGSEAENRTNSAQIKNIVDQLNTAVSGLDLTYNDLTGTLNMSTDAIKAQTQAMFLQKLQAAYIDRQVEASIQLKDAERDLLETQNLLTDAQAEYNKETALMRDDGSVRINTEKSQRAVQLEKDIKALTEREQEETQAVADLTDEYDYLSKAASGAGDAISDASKSASGSTDVFVAMSDSLLPLIEAWSGYKQAAFDAAQATTDLWNELDGSAKTTAPKIKETIEGQKQFWDDYATHLQELSDMGLDPKLLSDLADGTEESAQRAAALASGTQEDIDGINQAFADSQQAMSDWSAKSASLNEEMQTLVEDFGVQMEALTESMAVEDTAFTSGANAVVALMNGMRLEEPELYALMQTIVDNLVTMLSFNFANGANVGGLTLPTGKNIPLLYWTKHKTGLEHVPYDDYPALLHEGERVLTKEEAASYNTPTAEQMVRMPRQLSSNDISTAMGSALSSVKGGDTINRSLTIVSPKTLSPYEILREERRAERRRNRT